MSRLRCLILFTPCGLAQAGSGPAADGTDLDVLGARPGAVPSWPESLAAA